MQDEVNSSSTLAHEEAKPKDSIVNVKNNTFVEGDKVQPVATPLGLNRWVHLIYAIVVLCFWGPLVLNWSELATLFVKEGSYKWVCDGTTNNRVLFDGKCKYQEAILGQIGILAMGVYYIGAFVGGCLMDQLGPKKVSMIGGFLVTLSYLLLAISSDKRKTLYPYAIIQGFGTEFIFFGVVTIPNLFPGRRALILSLLAMARSISMLFCVLFRHTRTDTFNVNAMGYLFLAISIVIFIGNMFLVPTEAYKSIDESGKPLVQERVSKKYDYKLFGYTLCEPFYLTWLICDSLLLARAQFHVIAVPQQHPNVTTALGILLGVGFVLCPPIGYLIDRFGAAPIIFGMNVFGSVGFICLICGNALAAQWIGVLCIGVVLSFSGSQNYALIQERYVERMVGKLTGLVTCCGGAFSFTNTPLWNWGILNDKLKEADIVFLVYSCICTGLIILLWINPPCLSVNPCFKDAPDALLPTAKGAKQRQVPVEDTENRSV